MDQVTVEQLKKHVAENNVRRWKLRECSMCHAPLYYTFHADYVEFDSNCDCSRWSPPEIRSYEEPVRTLNTQQPDIRETMWNEIAASGIKQENA